MCGSPMAVLAASSVDMAVADNQGVLETAVDSTAAALSLAQQLSQ